MRAIVIDAEHRTVSETDIDGQLHSLQEIAGGLITPVYPGLEGTDHHAYVNDEGLLDNPQHFFMLRDGHQPLAGNGVILSTTDDGDEAPATLPLDWVRERVTFMDLQAAREWAAREPEQGELVASFVSERETADDAKVTTYVLRLGTPGMLDALEKAQSEPGGEAETAAGKAEKKPPDTKHTPGPWEHNGNGLIYGQVSGDADGAPLVADVIEDTELKIFGIMSPEETANARLIAAAPRLLSGLSSAVQTLESLYGEAETHDSEYLAELRGIVAEATGDDKPSQISRWGDGGAQKTGQGQKP
jgi:hypothetical protein